jgi:hypothetical protein
MKKWLSFTVVIIGIIGIVSHVLHDALFDYPDNPIMALGAFRYFTMQSALLATVYFLIIFLTQLDQRNERFRNFFGCVIISTTITFLVYNIFLAPIYHPEGLNMIGNIALHYINPVLIIVFLVMYRNEYTFSMKDTLIWLLFPFFYLIFMVIYGSITSDYLYPFFQISEIGLLGFSIAILGLLGLFFLLSFFLVKIVSKK